MKKKKLLKFKPILFVSILILIITISSTIAYFYNQINITNEFYTMLYDVDIVDVFYNDWGSKYVSFENNSYAGSPVVLRISYNEMWSNHIISNYIIEQESNVPSVNTSDTSGPIYNDGEDDEQDTEPTYTPRSEPFLRDDFYSGLDLLSNTINGENVVIKEWTDDFLNDFVLGDDGWYYYKKVLNPQDNVNVLSNINLNLPLLYNNADERFKYTSKEIEYYEYYDEYYTYDPEFSANYENYPYNYSLTFSFEAIQADNSAVSSIWNKNITIDEDGNVDWNL